MSLFVFTDVINLGYRPPNFELHRIIVREHERDASQRFADDRPVHGSSRQITLQLKIFYLHFGWNPFSWSIFGSLN